MKYLKKFNEKLNPSTYRRAASKFKKIGHVFVLFERSNE